MKPQTVEVPPRTRRRILAVNRRLVRSGLCDAIAFGLATPAAYAGVLPVGGSPPDEPSPIVSEVPYEPDVVLVRFKPGVDSSEQEEALEAVDGEIADEASAPEDGVVPGLEEVELPADVTVAEAATSRTTTATRWMTTATARTWLARLAPPATTASELPE